MADKLPPVPEEQVERPTGNLFGKTLSKLKFTKWSAVDDAKRQLFKRHSIDFKNADQYKIVEDRIVGRNGEERIELRLYELKDAAVVTIKSEVTSELQGGIKNLREFNRDGRQ